MYLRTPIHARDHPLDRDYIHTNIYIYIYIWGIPASHSRERKSREVDLAPASMDRDHDG